MQKKIENDLDNVDKLKELNNIFNVYVRAILHNFNPFKTP